LACAENDSGVTARDARDADPGLDVTDWIRTHASNDPDLPDHDNCWNGCAMIWWIRANDQVNVTPPGRPPEAANWAAILHKWDDSINAGFSRVPQNDRNNVSQMLYAEDGTTTEMPGGQYLAQQQLMINNVLSVLE
jgi:hypothetical protein